MHPEWPRISECLDRALELGASERDHYLNGLACENPKLAGEVRGFLAAYGEDKFERFLAGTAPFAAERSISGLIGRHVGPYVIEAEIGQGGMGSVWRASRADGHFEARVAVKFIHAAWLSRAGEERFRLEGRLLARLDHANIARLLDAGIFEAREPYLVLELVEGQPIDAFCEQKTLDVTARVKLFIDVLAAVAHAHSQLIVHRDLKPSNVLVTHGGVVKLLDFGVAKLIRENDSDAAPTVASERALTPEYAAPEQLLGKAVTTATDVYALGLLLYVLLAGIHPLRSYARSRPELYRAILTDDLPRLSAVATGPATRRRLLEGDLDNILAKALRKDAADRYQSVSAFADDLKRFLTHEPVTARPDTVPYRLAKFVRRHRGGVLVGLLIAGGLLSTSLFALVELSDARRQRDAARIELRRAEAANDFSSLILEEVGENGRLLSRDQLLDRGVKLLDARSGSDPEFVADMLLQLAGRYGDSERNDLAITLSKRSIEIARGTGNASLLAMSLCEGAHQEAQGEAHPDVDPWLNEARGLMQRLQDVPLRLDVTCLRAQAERASTAGQWEDAIAFLKHAHARQVAEGVHTGLDYTSIMNDLGGLYFKQGRYADAYASTLEVGAAFDRGGRGGTTGRLIIHENTAANLIRMGEPRAALVELEAARHPPSGRLSDQDTPVAMRPKLSMVLRRLGRLQEARDIVNGVADQLLGTDNPRLGTYALVEEASIRFEMDEPEAARDNLQRAIELLSKNPAARLDSLADAHALLANIEVQSGHAEAARRRLENFLNLAGYQKSRTNRVLRPALLSAANTLQALGDLRAAESYARDALAIAEASARSKDSSADVGEALTVLAQLNLVSRRPLEAKSLLNRAVRCFTNGLGEDAPRTAQARAALRDILLGT